MIQMDNLNLLVKLNIKEDLKIMKGQDWELKRINIKRQSSQEDLKEIRKVVMDD